ncbi:MAG: phosphotransferase family protein [Proteobacteria bacterium]|nr:phosphotransferase family protein [Pseudomonadota bacterium]
MSEVSNQLLEEIFTRIPLLADFRVEDFKIDPLPGYTNQNFRISNNHGDWVLRIPKDETNRYIDRQAEASNASIAHRLGLAPERVWFDASGLSLSATLRHTRSVTREELQQKPMQLRLAHMLNKLHHSDSAFQGTVDLGALLTRYYRLMPEGAQVHFNKAYDNAKIILATLTLRDVMLVPSHNDLVLENLLLDESGRLWVIDWEYSSMASPYWDLATLCNAANLDHEQSFSLLRACHGASGDPGMELLIDYRSVLQVLSDCWMAAVGAG